MQLHPLWLQEYNAYLTAQELKKMGVKPPQKLLAKIHGEKFFETDIQEGEILEPNISPWKPSPEDIAIARKLWRENGWTKESLLFMLRSRFGITSLKEIQKFSKDEFELFLNYLEYLKK